MRSYGGVVNAFSRVRKSWHNVYTQVVETPPPQKIQERPGIRVQQGVEEDTGLKTRKMKVWVWL